MEPKSSFEAVQELIANYEGDQWPLPEGTFSHPRSNGTFTKVLRSQHARLPELSGEHHPYREGPLGVIREGAYADILLVDGNPLDDVSILGDGGKNFPVIMKDGKIYKNTP